MSPLLTAFGGFDHESSKVPRKLVVRVFLGIHVFLRCEHRRVGERR